MHRKEPKLKVYEGRYSLKEKEVPAAEGNSDDAEKEAADEPDMMTEKENTVEDTTEEKKMRNLTMLTDLYEITMMYGYFKCKNKHEDIAVYRCVFQIKQQETAVMQLWQVWIS